MSTTTTVPIRTTNWSISARRSGSEVPELSGFRSVIDWPVVAGGVPDLVGLGCTQLPAFAPPPVAWHMYPVGQVEATFGLHVLPVLVWACASGASARKESESASMKKYF